MFQNGFLKKLGAVPAFCPSFSPTPSHIHSFSSSSWQLLNYFLILSKFERAISLKDDSTFLKLNGWVKKKNIEDAAGGKAVKMSPHTFFL